MKVLFLDIDGVLNVRNKRTDRFGGGFEDTYLVNLGRIVQETGCDIVLSSSWRKKGFSVMREMWIERNMPGILLDTTTSIRLQKGGCIKYHNGKTQQELDAAKGYSIPRGCEIEYWLKEYKFQRINWSRDKQIEYMAKTVIENYVILDDDSDFLLSQAEHFVHTNRQNEPDAFIGKGLTNAAADKAIKILNTYLPDLYYR